MDQQLSWVAIGWVTGDVSAVLRSAVEAVGVVVVDAGVDSMVGGADMSSFVDRAGAELSFMSPVRERDDVGFDEHVMSIFAAMQTTAVASLNRWSPKGF